MWKQRLSKKKTDLYLKPPQHPHCVILGVWVLEFCFTMLSEPAQDYKSLE